MKDIIGYNLKLTAEVKYSETAIRGGRSSARLVRPNAQQDTSEAPLMGPLQCAAADALQEVQHKHPGMGTVRNCSAMVFSFPEIQASSDKRQAPSNKHQATSHKQQAPRYVSLEKVSRTSDQGA